MKAKRYRTILIDDEELALSALNHLISEHCPELKVERVFMNPQEAKAYLLSHSIDLAFIDIRMPEHNGLELVKSLEESQTKYVFSTAYSEYAVEAWQTDAIGYLLKPIDSDDLVETVKKIKRILDPQPELNHVHINGYDIYLEDLIYGESSGSYTDIYFNKKQNKTLTVNLKKVLELLPKSKIFRIRREQFIHILYLDSYNPKSKELKLLNGKTMTVSVRRAPDFMQFLRANNFQW